MEKCGRSITIWFAFLFIVFYLEIVLAGGDGGQNLPPNSQQKPSFAKIVKETLSKLKKSHVNSWDKIKTIVHDVHLKFFPPNLESGAQEAKEKSTEDGQGGGTKEKMKEAAEKSFETIEMTAEESAKSAANVAGEAMHKVGDKLSHDDEEKSRDREEL
ncbi:hypothetical protein JCGZ_09420 [Jatropha curcas]|uniref:Uncharacterized protein n=1 Tax=Jatropha curcas TaxID=180498 RepID=A0A067KGC7_JATCU|nr:uncharacterized protein LOC105636628 isoform X2 [Jatropha curcas]KDP35261.1 hypothetical protein JCGZ_09420 [Jatropha curcas]